MSKPTDKHLFEIIRPLPRAAYEVACGFSHVQRMLDRFADDYGLDLEPDFQRGHVWTTQQQERWIEAVLRGVITGAGLTIQFNSPAFAESDGDADCELSTTLLCVDGLQRLTATLRFMRGEIRPFGYAASDLTGTSFDPVRMTYRLNIAVHALKTRQELLQYYLDINSGGTPHSEQELDRVREMLVERVLATDRPKC